MKEKKGLFARLASFWKENIQIGLEESIGFWIGAEKERQEESSGRLFAKQERKTLWQEGAAVVPVRKNQETGLLAQEKMIFAAAAQEQGKEMKRFAEKSEGTRKADAAPGKTGLFSTGKAEKKQNRQERETDGLFLAGGIFRRETETSGRSKILWRQPEEEAARRRIVPAAAKKEAEMISERKAAGQETFAARTEKREEKQTEPSFDIDVLMGQITKRLWEERESCGRRLRG